MFTIGGGYAMIPLLENEVVSKRMWLTRQEFLDMIAISQMSPGVFAINCSIYIGYKIKKNLGSISAMTGCALPSFVIILVIALFFENFRSYPLVEQALKGIRPVVVALIAAPMIRIAQKSGTTWKTAPISILGTIAICCLGISPMYIIILGIIGGLIWGFAKSKQHP
jgi:chromate transporter